MNLQRDNDRAETMTMSKRLGLVAVPSLIWVALAWPVGTLLSACSGVNPSSVATKSDLQTESDEPALRRRARIRLELASGYFEKGQTTVALDEVKQSIATDPSLFEAYNLRGLIYTKLDDVRLAEESYKRALTLNPSAASVQHNYGWLLCHHDRLPEALQLFGKALATPAYGDRSKTWMAQGLCQLKAGQKPEAEASLLRSYELDAGNPVTGYNLALLLFQRGDFTRSQFYVRRINNSDFANAESLWLGIRVERKVANRDAMAQLGAQLKKRFGDSPELTSYERGAFDE
jgi:type IV pilus assembly protein PilF